MGGPPLPSHRSVDQPQPEICELCGTIVPAHELLQSDVEGLRGRFICNTTPGCRRFRAAMSWRDRKQRSGNRSSTIGDGRVYPAGQTTWAE